MLCAPSTTSARGPAPPSASAAMRCLQAPAPRCWCSPSTAPCAAPRRSPSPVDDGCRLAEEQLLRFLVDARGGVGGFALVIRALGRRQGADRFMPAFEMREVFH